MSGARSERFLAASGNAEWIPTSEDQARIDAGIAFEQTVFTKLMTDQPSAVLVEQKLSKAAMIAATVRAMDLGAPLILGGRLPDDVDGGRTGRPDLLIRWESGYLPADVKNHLTLRPLKTEKSASVALTIGSPEVRLPLAGWTAATTHRYEDGLQLAHYTRMLQSCGHHPGIDHLWGAVLGTSLLDLGTGDGPQLNVRLAQP